MRGSERVVLDLSTGLPNAIVTGVVLGSIIALGAIGLALVYNIAEVPNFAHGELLTLGAYLAFFVNKPSEVPLFNELLAGPRTISTVGTVVLFGLTGGAVLGVVSQVGGDGALSGAWWPYDVSPATGYLTHLGFAAFVGAVVVVSTPSIWGGLLFSAVGVAAVAPVFDRRVFRKFRERGDDLATLLIAALGLSFVLRYGIQAFFGSDSLNYVLPERADLGVASPPLAETFLFDVFWTGSTLVVEIISTAGEGRESLAVVDYGLPILGAVVVVPVVAAVLSYRWRESGTGGSTGGQTVGPRLSAALAWVLVTAVLVVGLAGDGTVPGNAAYQTRIRLSFVRALTVVIAVAMMGSLHALLKQTKLGVAMRASSDNLDLAKVTGINTDRVMMASWVVAGAFSAIGGVMLGVLFVTVTPNTGFNLLLPMFAAVILGGVETVYGAMVGSYVVGLAMSVGIFYLPLGGIHRVSVAFVVLIVILLVKPDGILGGR